MLRNGKGNAVFSIAYNTYSEMRNMEQVLQAAAPLSGFLEQYQDPTTDTVTIRKSEFKEIFNGLISLTMERGREMAIIAIREYVKNGGQHG